MFALSGSGPGAAAAGTWRLLPGQAVTLQPRREGVLRVAAGTLWATGDGPHAGPVNALGDRVLPAGGTLDLHPGERVVLEAVGGTAPARFAWDSLPPWDTPRGSASGTLWRLAMLVLASALTGSIWFGAMAVSGGHRADVAQPAAAIASLQAMPPLPQATSSRRGEPPA